MVHLVENERRKLLASALDRLSTAAFVAALIAPAASFLSGSAPANVWIWASYVIVWVIMGMLLHLAGRRVLGELEE